MNKITIDNNTLRATFSSTNEPPAPQTPTAPIVSAAAAKIFHSPDFAQLNSPLPTHSPGYLLSGANNLKSQEKKKHRRFINGLPLKPIHTVAPGSASKRHTKKIREEKIQPNEEGVFKIHENGELFGYGLHTQKADSAKKRLYPKEIEGGSKRVRTFTGPELYQKLNNPKAKLTFS